MQPTSIYCERHETFVTARDRLFATPFSLVVTNLRLREFNGLHLVHLVTARTNPPRSDQTLSGVHASGQTSTRDGSTPQYPSGTGPSMSRPVGSSVTVPTALNVANTTLIWSEVQYAYTPTIGYVITGTLNLSDQIYMRPRLSDTVSRVNS